MSRCIHGLMASCQICAINKQQGHAMSINWLHEKIENLENSIAGMQKQINEVIGMMVKGDNAAEDDFLRAMRRIDCLINQINTLEENKKPHKCPICEGSGHDKNHIIKDSNWDFAFTYASCNSCNGKGIV